MSGSQVSGGKDLVLSLESYLSLPNPSKRVSQQAG